MRRKSHKNVLTIILETSFLKISLFLCYLKFVSDLFIFFRLINYCRIQMYITSQECVIRLQCNFLLKIYSYITEIQLVHILKSYFTYIPFFCLISHRVQIPGEISIRKELGYNVNTQLFQGSCTKKLTFCCSANQHQ